MCIRDRAESIRTSVKQVLRESELITSIDYISVADSVTLDEVDVVSSESMLSVAVRIGSIRLIDNVILAQSR